MIKVTIKQSKTDMFRRGVDLFLGKIASDLFLVAALHNYLVVRGPVGGPLFPFKDGRLLTRQRSWKQ